MEANTRGKYESCKKALGSHSHAKELCKHTENPWSLGNYVISGYSGWPTAKWLRGGRIEHSTFGYEPNELTGTAPPAFDYTLFKEGRSITPVAARSEGVIWLLKKDMTVTFPKKRVCTPLGCLVWRKFARQEKNSGGRLGIKKITFKIFNGLSCVGRFTGQRGGLAQTKPAANADAQIEAKVLKALAGVCAGTGGQAITSHGLTERDENGAVRVTSRVRDWVGHLVAIH